MNLNSLIAAAWLLGAQPPEMPAGMSHEEHLKQIQKDDALKKRGADAMGFDQDAATHHFILSAAGGSIEVTANNKTDEAAIAAMRGHLRSIANEFGDGRFDKPFQTHGDMPPGVAVMQSRKQRIHYHYEDLPLGGAVRIQTKDARSLDAVHAFLRYQIIEHRTGDPLTESRPSAPR